MKYTIKLLAAQALILSALVLITSAQAQTRYMDIITNSSLVTHTYDSALYQINLTDSISKIDLYCNSQDDIAIYRQGVQLKKRGIYRAGTKCLLYWYGPKTAGASDTFNLHLGDSVDALGQLLLTKSVSYISFDSLIYDGSDRDISLTGEHSALYRPKGTVNNPVSYFGNGLGVDSGSYAQISPYPAVQGTTTLFISMVVMWTNFASANSYFFLSSVQYNRWVQTQSSGNIIFILESDSVGGINNVSNAPLSTNAPNLIEMVFNGSGATNADRLKVYFNGVQQDVNFPAGGVPTQFHSGSSSAIIGSSITNPYKEIDEVNISTDITTFDPDRYNMLFNPLFFNKSKIHQTPFAIDSVEIRQGFYLRFSQKSVVFDSVYFDMAKSTIVGQSGSHLEFVPALPATTQKKYPVVFYYAGGSYSVSFASKKAFGLWGSIGTGVYIGL